MDASVNNVIGLDEANKTTPACIKQYKRLEFEVMFCFPMKLKYHLQVAAKYMVAASESMFIINHAAAEY